VFSLFSAWENVRMPETIDFPWTMNTKKKRKSTSLIIWISKSIYYLLVFTKYSLSVHTNSGGLLQICFQNS
jgi:hypothetical protein